MQIPLANKADENNDEDGMQMKYGQNLCNSMGSA